MKRYSIMVKEEGSDHEVELCQVNSSPKSIADALSRKTLRTSSEDRQYRIPKYTWIRVVDSRRNRSTHLCGRTAGECRHVNREEKFQ
jgi:hypothetical protein